MTKARKLRIWTMYDGRCDGCGCPVESSGPSVAFDHRIPIWIAPELDDDGPNVRPLCIPCHSAKTAQTDQPAIAKIKRLIGRQEGTRRPRKAIAGRGFDKGLSKKFSGEVVRRPR